MKFQAAFSYLKRGHDITLPEWGGFWRWHEEGKTIHMHTRHGTILDIRKSEDMDYTLGFTFRDDWELVEDPSQTEHANRLYSPDLPDVVWTAAPPPLCASCGVRHFLSEPCPPAWLG